MGAGETEKNAWITRLTQEIQANDQLTDRVKGFLQTQLLNESTNPVFVREIKRQNAKNISIDEIKKIDAEWKAEDGNVPLHEELMTNACAREAEKLYDKYPIVELFVMDNQGANVGQANETSDIGRGMRQNGKIHIIMEKGVWMSAKGILTSQPDWLIRKYPCLLLMKTVPLSGRSVSGWI